MWLRTCALAHSPAHPLTQTHPPTHPLTCPPTHLPTHQKEGSHADGFARGGELCDTDLWLRVMLRVSG